MKLYSNEIVFRGHPDKICDQISDALLDAYISGDPYTRAGIEVVGGKGKIFVTGEVTSKTDVDVEAVVRRVLKDVGCTNQEYEIIDNIGKQSPDIAQGVDVGGAGDQGMMFGYACNDTDRYIPTAMAILQDVSKLYDTLHQSHPGDFYADGKAQITGYYDDDFKLQKIKTFTISYQNPENNREWTDTILKNGIIEICGQYGIEVEEFLINPTGKFQMGGFEADCGETGRKIVVEAYQSFCPVGGGAMCVDAETQYLTESGWASISHYDGEKKIAQYNNGRLEFVHPSAYIVNKAEWMFHVTTPQLDMMLSPQHDVVLQDTDGKLLKKTAQSIFNYDVLNVIGKDFCIPTTFSYVKEGEIALNNEEIELQTYFCLHGILDTKALSYRITTKDEHLKFQLRKFVGKFGDMKEVKSDSNISSFYFEPPLPFNSLYLCFSEASSSQLRIVADIIKSQFVNGKYGVKQLVDADFIQFLMTGIYGYTVKKTFDIEKGKYLLSYSDNVKAQLPFAFDMKYPTDGKMYCFTVPSGMLVLRRNGKIFITGNCGKDGTKVDRSAAYKARQLAIRMMKEKQLKWCEVQLSYAIGVEKPLAIYLDSNQGNIEPPEEWYDECTPKKMIEEFKLRQPGFEETAMFGHFGHNFRWEKD